jgi:hypothetical protein
MNLPGQGIQLYARLNWRNLRDSSNDMKVMDNSDSLLDRRDFSVVQDTEHDHPANDQYGLMSVQQ